MCSCFFFVFKQKTAYEMRISDWSSDVCSSDLADIKGQRPAIAVGKVFETRHRRALKALRNHLIEREQATLARARRVRESNRWRIEPRGARAVSGTGRAMAHGTIFRVKLRAARQIGSQSRRQRNGVAYKQSLGEPPRLFFDRRRRRFRSDRLTTGGGASHQVRLRGLLRQAFQSRFDLGCKHVPPGIFGRTERKRDTDGES